MRPRHRFLTDSLGNGERHIEQGSLANTACHAQRAAQGCQSFVQPEQAKHPWFAAIPRRHADAIVANLELHDGGICREPDVHVASALRSPAV